MKGARRPPLWPEIISEALEDFRISQPLEILTLLGRMSEQAELVLLMTDGGASALSAIAGIDRARRLLWMFGDRNDPRLRQLTQGDRVAAVGYLDDVKIQFDALNLQWLPGGDGGLACLLPLELYRFQRRSHFRVRPLQSPPATVRFPFGGAARPCELRVIDISMTGVGLHLLDGASRFDVGLELAGVVMALEPGVQLTADLRVVHVTRLKESEPGYQMGCVFEGMSLADMRLLQRFIDQAQLRQRGMPLEPPAAS